MARRRVTSCSSLLSMSNWLRKTQPSYVLYHTHASNVGHNDRAYTLRRAHEYQVGSTIPPTPAACHQVLWELEYLPFGGTTPRRPPSRQVHLVPGRNPCARFRGRVTPLHHSPQNSVVAVVGRFCDSCGRGLQKIQLVYELGQPLKR